MVRHASAGLRHAVCAAALLAGIALAPEARAAVPTLDVPGLSSDFDWFVNEQAVLGFGFGGARRGGDGGEFPASLFAQEVLAFAMREAFPDAEEEYLGTSRIPTRLSVGMPDRQNLIGEHALDLANRVGSILLDALGTRSVGTALSPSSLERSFSFALAAGTIVRGVWQSLRNDIVDAREGVSLKPKISGRKVAFQMTVRW